MLSASRRRVHARGVLVLLVLSASFSVPSIPHSTSAQQAWSLPSPWNAQDIGNPAIAGNVVFDQGTFSIDASGADIGGRSDQFTFIYQQVTGDVDVIARVNSVSSTDARSEAGVMIRNSLAANAANGYALVSAGRGVAFQRRRSDGGQSMTTTGPSVTAPYWVRLVRQGSTVTAYSSANGNTWSMLTSRTVTLGSTVYAGIATSSHNASAITSAVVSQVSVNHQQTSNQPPTVSLTAPANGASFTAPATVSLSASASDSDGTVSKVEFYNGPTLLNTDTVAPYSWAWMSVPAGTYDVRAVAYDDKGASAPSATATITVGAVANQPPTVSLTAPANGATFTAPASVTLSASASDSDGTISKVEFYNGTTVLNTDTVAPYSWTWGSVAAGTYTVKAVAYDNAGASASSSNSTVTVTSSAAIPPPWTAADIGSPALSGSSTYSNSVFSVDVGGVDIWNTSDEFHFIYQPIAGDVEIVARVDSLTAVDPFTNAGVMVRGTLQAGSLHGYTALTGSNGAYFRQRVTTGGTTTSIGVPGVTAPTWVRLVRQGSVVTSYWSANGSTWTSIGSQSLALGTTAYVGLAVSSHNATVRTSARFSNVRVSSPANQPPTITLTSPTSGSTFTAPATVTLNASATDSDGTISKVEFYNGTTLLGTDTTSPYSFSWLSVAAGTYAVKAIAFDNSNASTSSATINITVSAPTSGAPTGIVFTASPDHATLVTSYELRIYAAGANPSTATPIAISNLGKPTPDANNDITVALSSFFVSLAPGNYVAAVAAIGAGGSSVSTGVSFTR